jgi:hypothetical protein
MASTVDARERSQGDLDDLLSRSAMLAKALLIRNGEFFPFGATIGTRGKFALVTPVPEVETPTAHDVIASIVEELEATRSGIRACAVVAMAVTEGGVDAVRIELEHSDGSSLVIALPYARGELGAFAYGDMEAHRIKPRIWVTPPVSIPPPAKTPGPAKHKSAESSVSAPRKKPSGANNPATSHAPTSHKARPARAPLHAQPALF